MIRKPDDEEYLKLMMDPATAELLGGSSKDNPYIYYHESGFDYLIGKAFVFLDVVHSTSECLYLFNAVGIDVVPPYIRKNILKGESWRPVFLNSSRVLVKEWVKDA